MAVKIAARSLGYALTPQTVGRSLHLPIFTKSQRFPNFSPGPFFLQPMGICLLIYTQHRVLSIIYLSRALPVNLDKRRVRQACGRFWPDESSVRD